MWCRWLRQGRSVGEGMDQVKMRMEGRGEGWKKSIRVAEGPGRSSVGLSQLEDQEV